MGWFALSLGAAIAWSIVQLVDKTLISNEAPSAGHYLIASGFAAVIPVFIMHLAIPSHVPSFTSSQTLASMGAGMAYFAASAFFFKALQYIDASVTAAALAVVPPATAIGAWLLLDERFSLAAVGGIVTIAAGVAIMSRPVGGGPHKFPAYAWWFVAGCASLLVLEYLIEGAMVTELHPLEVFYGTRLGVLLATASLVIANRRMAREAGTWAFKENPRVGLLTIGNEALDMLAIALLIGAYARGPIGLATSVAYSQAAFVFLLTLLVNRIRKGTIPTEGDKRVHIRVRGVGLVLVILGILLANAVDA